MAETHEKDCQCAECSEYDMTGWQGYLEKVKASLVPLTDEELQAQLEERGRIMQEAARKREVIRAKWEERYPWLDDEATDVPPTDCESCPLLFSPGPVCWDGPEDADFALVAEAPGRNEAEDGVPMVGPSGYLADRIMERVGTSRDRVYVTNTVLCRSLDARGGDAPPPTEAINACNRRLMSELVAANPKVIVSTGNTPTRTLMKTETNITSVAGTAEWLPSLSRPIIPTFHTAYALRGGGESAMANIQGSFKRAVMMARDELAPPEAQRTPVEFKYAVEPYQARYWLRRIWERPGVWSLDTETEYADDPDYGLLTVQISNGTDTYVFEHSAIARWRSNVGLMRALLLSDEHRWVIHNASFDNKYLHHHYGATPKHLEDSMALALCLTERGQDVGLKILSRQWLNAPHYEAELDKYGKPSAKNPMSKIPRPVLTKYGAEDAKYTANLYPILEGLVEEEGNRQLYTDILRPCQETFADMEYRGVRLNEERRQAIEDQMQPHVDRLREEIQDHATSKGFQGTFNPNSVPDKQKLLYDLMGYPTIGGGKPTGKEFYEQEWPRAPISKLLSQHAKLSKMMGTYVKGLSKHVWPDGRIHPSFRLFGTVTGRISCAEPNLQNIPNMFELYGDPIKMRTMFEAAPGFVFFEADFSILEVYTGYHYSHDPLMWHDLTSGDFHTRVAATCFGIPEEKVTKTIRNKAKRITYGIMYGITADGLSDIMPNTTKLYAQQHLDRWFARYSMYHEWWKEQRDTARDTGRLMTPTGRIRRWNLIKDRSALEDLYKQAVNFPNQSLAGDQCLMSLVELNQRFKEHRLGFIELTVHDSIEGEIYEDKLDQALEIIREVMPRPKFETVIPEFPIEIEIGQNWGELVEV